MITDTNLYHPVTIGSLEIPGNLFLAPVAGYSDRAFRTLCIEHGANFTYTEMVSAEALVRSSAKTVTLMARAVNECRYAVQIFGSDPSIMAKAADLVCKTVKPECIDINAGCPVPKIVKTGAGSALTRDPERLHAVTTAVVKATGDTPVTVKIRSGWDDKTINWKEAACAALEAGVAALTIHPRTRAQGYEGSSDWNILAELSAFVKGRNNRSTDTNCPRGACSRPVPVFGSGDLFSPEAARRMLEQTGCDGIMFARGALGNPFIFTQTRELLTLGKFSDIPPKERLLAGWRELQLLTADTDEYIACREMRKRFCAYSKGIEGGAALRLDFIKAETVEHYRHILQEHGYLLANSATPD